MSARIPHSTIVVLLVILALSPPFTCACIDPAGHYAVEVVLNKPGTAYNLIALREHLGDRLIVVDNSTYLFKYSVQYKEPSREEVLKQLDFMVMLYEAKFSEGAPYIEGLSNPENVEYYLGVRLELIAPLDTEVCVVKTTTHTTVSTTTRSEDQHRCLTVYSDDFKRVLGDLLNILVNKWQVVSGLAGDDVIKIVKVAEPGLAGWNNRLVYSVALDTWKPYYELVFEGYINGVLIRGNACSIRIPSDVVKELGKLSPSILLDLYVTAQPSTNTTSPEEIATTPAVTSSSTQVTQPYITAPPPTTLKTNTTISASYMETVNPPAGGGKEFNEWAVVISLAAGTAIALVVYLVFSKRY